MSIERDTPAHFHTTVHRQRNEDGADRTEILAEFPRDRLKTILECIGAPMILSVSNRAVSMKAVDLQ